MASVGEGDCHKDPNFAVICSFFDNYSASLGLPEVSYTELQKYLEDTSSDVSNVLIDIHVRLLRRIGKSTVTPERFEKNIIKFIHHYSEFDAWEVESYGYKHAKLDTKLRILKNLLECQFDYNVKFKEKVNESSAEDMRFLPIGRDKEGQAYWYFLDKDMNLLVYKEEQDDDAANTWQLVCSDRQDLAKLVNALQNGDHNQIQDQDKPSPIDSQSSKEGSHEKDLDKKEVAVKLEENGCIENILGESKERFMEIKIHKCDLLEPTKQESREPKTGGLIVVKKEVENEGGFGTSPSRAKKCPTTARALVGKVILDGTDEKSCKHAIDEHKNAGLATDKAIELGQEVESAVATHISKGKKLNKISEKTVQSCSAIKVTIEALDPSKDVSDTVAETIEESSNNTQISSSDTVQENLNISSNNSEKIDSLSLSKQCLDSVQAGDAYKQDDSRNSEVTDISKRADESKPDVTSEPASPKDQTEKNELQETNESVINKNKVLSENFLQDSVTFKSEDGVLSEITIAGSNITENSAPDEGSQALPVKQSEEEGIKKSASELHKAAGNSLSAPSSEGLPTELAKCSHTSKDPPDKPGIAEVTTCDSKQSMAEENGAGLSIDSADKEKSGNGNGEKRPAVSLVDDVLQRACDLDNTESVVEKGQDLINAQLKVPLEAVTTEDQPMETSSVDGIKPRNISDQTVKKNETSTTPVIDPDAKESTFINPPVSVESNESSTTQQEKPEDATKVDSVKSIDAPVMEEKSDNSTTQEITSVNAAVADEDKSGNGCNLGEIIDKGPTLGEVNKSVENATKEEDNSSVDNQTKETSIQAENSALTEDTSCKEQRCEQSSGFEQNDENEEEEQNETIETSSAGVREKPKSVEAAVEENVPVKSSLAKDKKSSENTAIEGDNIKTSLVKENKCIEDVTAEENKSVDNINTEETKSIETPTTEKNKSIDTPNTEDNKSIKTPTTEDNKSIETPTNEENQSVETPTTEENKSVETPSAQEKTSLETPITEENKSIETPITEDNKSIETPTAQDNKSIETPTAQDNKSTETLTTEENKSVETPIAQEKTSLETHLVEENKSIETPITEDNKSIETPTAQDNKSTETLTTEENKSVETPIAQEKTSLETPLAEENKSIETTNTDNKSLKTSMVEKNKSIESSSCEENKSIETPGAEANKSVETPMNDESESTKRSSTEENKSIETHIETHSSEENKYIETPAAEENTTVETPMNDKSECTKMPSTKGNKTIETTFTEENKSIEPPLGEENKSIETLGAEENKSVETLMNEESDSTEMPSTEGNQSIATPKTDVKKSIKTPVTEENRSVEENNYNEPHTTKKIKSVKTPVTEKKISIKTSKKEVSKASEPSCSKDDNHVNASVPVENKSVSKDKATEISCGNKSSAADSKETVAMGNTTDVISNGAIVEAEEVSKMNCVNADESSSEPRAAEEISTEKTVSIKPCRSKSASVKKNSAKVSTKNESPATMEPESSEPHRNLKRSAPEPGSDEPVDSEPNGKRSKQAARAQKSRRGRNAAARGRAARMAHYETESEDSETPLSQIRSRRQVKAAESKEGSCKVSSDQGNKKASENDGDENITNGKRAKKKKQGSSSEPVTEEEVTPAKKGRNLTQTSASNKKASAAVPSKAAKKTSPKSQAKSQNEDEGAGVRRSQRVRQLKAKRPPTPSSQSEASEGEEGDSEGDKGDQDFFDSSFTPEEESGDEEFKPKGRNFQRQAARTGHVNDEEVVNDDTPCVKCGKYNHPEMILLCDKCDAGYHTACLRPPLMLIPDGDWFCPPCEHLMLITKLLECLQTLDNAMKKKDRLHKRQERLAFVGINISNILHGDRKTVIPSKAVEDDREGEENNESDAKDDSGSPESSESEAPRRTFRSERLALRQAQKRSRQEKNKHRRARRKESPEGEILTKRTCRLRNAVSYQFKEFDELISNAIEDDKPCRREKPPGIRRGKDMSNILGASDEEDEKIRLRDGDSGGPPPVVKKRTKRKLTKLDSDEEPDEDDESDEFKLSEEDNSSDATEVEEEDEDASTSNLDSGDWKPKKTWYNSHSPSHRPKRKAKSFVIDDDEYESEENSSKRRSTRNSSRGRIHYNVWDSEDDETEEEQSTSDFCSEDSESFTSRKKKTKLAAGKSKGGAKAKKADESDEHSDSSIARRRKLLRKLVKKRRKDNSDSQDTEIESQKKQEKSSKKKKSSSEGTECSATEESDEGTDESPKFKKKNVLRSSDEETETEAEKPGSDQVEKPAVAEGKQEVAKSITAQEAPVKAEENEVKPEGVTKSKARMGPKSKQAKGKKRNEKQEPGDSASVADGDVPDKVRKVSDEEAERTEEMKSPPKRKPPARRQRGKSKEGPADATQPEKSLQLPSSENALVDPSRPVTKKKKVPNFLDVPSGGEESDDQKSNKLHKLSQDNAEKETAKPESTPAAQPQAEAPTNYGSFPFSGQQAHSHHMQFPPNPAHYHPSHAPEDMSSYPQELPTAHAGHPHPRQLTAPPGHPPPHFDHPHYPPPRGGMNPMHQAGSPMRHPHPTYPAGANPAYHYQPNMNQGYQTQEPGEVLSQGHKSGTHSNFPPSGPQHSKPPQGHVHGAMPPNAHFHMGQQDITGGYMQGYGPNRMPLPQEMVPQGRRDLGPGSVREMGPGHVREISPGSVREMGPGSVREMGPGSVREMGPGRVRAMGPGNVREMGPGRVRDMGPGNVREMGPENVREMGPANVREMGPANVREMGPGNVREMGPGNVREMGPGNVREMGPGNVREMGPGNVREMGPGNMGPANIREMSPGKVREMGPRHLREMGPGNPREMGPVNAREMGPGNMPHPYYRMQPPYHNIHQHYPPHYQGGMPGHPMTSPLNSMGQMTKNLGHEQGMPASTFSNVPSTEGAKEHHQRLASPHRQEAEQQHYMPEKGEMSKLKNVEGKEGKRAKTSIKSRQKSKVLSPQVDVTDPPVTASKVSKMSTGEQDIALEEKDVPRSVAPKDPSGNPQPGLVGYKSPDQTYSSSGHMSSYPMPYAAHSQHQSMPMAHMPPKHGSFMPPTAHMSSHAPAHGSSAFKTEMGHAGGDVKPSIADIKGDISKQNLSPTEQRPNIAYPNVSLLNPAKVPNEPPPSHLSQANVAAMSYPQRFSGPSNLQGPNQMSAHGSYYHGPYYHSYGPPPGQAMHPPNTWPQNMPSYGPRMGSSNVYPYGMHPEAMNQGYNMMPKNAQQSTKEAAASNASHAQANPDTMNTQFSKSLRHSGSGSEEDHPPNAIDKSEGQKSQSASSKDLSDSTKPVNEGELPKDAAIDAQQKAAHAAIHVPHRPLPTHSGSSSQGSDTPSQSVSESSSTNVTPGAKQSLHTTVPVSTAAMNSWAESVHYHQQRGGPWPGMNDPGQFRMMQPYASQGMMGGAHYPSKFQQQQPAHTNPHLEHKAGHTDGRAMGGPGPYLHPGYHGFEAGYQPTNCAPQLQGQDYSRGPQRPDFNSKQSYKPQAQEDSLNLSADQSQSGDDQSAEANAASKPKRAKTQKKSAKEGGPSGRVRSAKGRGRGRGGFMIDNLLQARAIEGEEEGDDSGEMKDIVSYVTTDDYFKQQTSS